MSNERLGRSNKLKHCPILTHQLLILWRLEVAEAEEEVSLVVVEVLLAPLLDGVPQAEDWEDETDGIQQMVEVSGRQLLKI